MTALVIVLAILVVLFGSTTWFFGREMMKKFKLFNSFAKSSHHLLKFHHGGRKTPAMRSIVLRSEDGESFTALVGFHLKVPLMGVGFDYYGYVESDEHGVAVVSTYIGKGPVTFQFFVNRDLETNPVTVSSKSADQKLPPNVIYEPHWYQHLGFYG